MIGKVLKKVIDVNEYRYILGAGGFAKEVLNMYIDLNEPVQGFIKKDECVIEEFLNEIPIYDESFIFKDAMKNIKLICAIGDGKIREKIVEPLERMGYNFDTLVHPSVIKSRWVDFDIGCIICAGNILTTQIIIGKHTIINLSCTVGHDTIIGNYVTISPGVNISGNVKIGDYCFIGTGAKIIEGISIGEGSIIGAGATVIRDIPPHTVAVGVPAKAIKKLR